ncbi:exonuclease domain-containing protein [Streptomyces varsoviensis]|uniref:DNA polymerase III subunit epsilon n=1 Tax=Streptomyces varsoviensis TaxID=67373 RepID=A0ABR5J2B5_9ACTN|nr:exonuclease domain-containing protein [Streptomyces varsoviensis]KOG87555.1 DNA polymerase III subunit epsilon [Streptomyces varsoviensis]
MSWYRGTLTGFDLETTGTDVEHDRVVTAALVRLEPGGAVAGERTWLLDPGIAIPEQAAAIHGISTDRARAHGSPAATAIAEIAEAVAEVLRAGAPLVVMNARYDLSLLDRECRRHGVEPLSERLGPGPWPIVDPLVLDKYADRYRKGKRTLQALCAHYGVALDAAHRAEADALAAARTARRVGETYAPVGSMPIADLYELQVAAAAEQSASLQSYLRRTSNPAAYIEPAWPVIPYAEARRAEEPSAPAAGSIPAQRIAGHPRVN